MALGVVIRLKNLPLAAGAIDIRHFFSGLRIPDGGVHIIGGDDGTAFILFSTDEDARQAMMRDRETICGESIKLFLSSQTEMKQVTEESQRIYHELSGIHPPQRPVDNLPERHTTKSYHPPPSQIPGFTEPEPEGVYVEMQGVPFNADHNDIAYFFSPLHLVTVRFLLDEQGRKSSIALIKFASCIDKEEAVKKDRSYMGSRFITVTAVPRRQWILSGSQPCQTVQVGGGGGGDVARKRQQVDDTVGSDYAPKKLRGFSPPPLDTCVEIHGLPSTATFEGVTFFFAPLKFMKGGLFMEMDGNGCRGRAYIEFQTYTDFKGALLKDGDIFVNKKIRVMTLSKQAMLEQLQINKKYIINVLDEEIARENDLRRQLEKKKKEEEYAQRKREHQIRKQKEMDEWLLRQHQKEEEERKLEYEQRLAINQQYEDREQRQLKTTSANEVPQPEETAANGQMRAHKRMSDSPQHHKPGVLSGAGEMDIEADDDTGSHQQPSISVYSSVAKTPAKFQQSTSQPPMFPGTNRIPGNGASNYFPGANALHSALQYPPPFPPPNFLPPPTVSNVYSAPNSLPPLSKSSEIRHSISNDLPHLSAGQPVLQSKHSKLSIYNEPPVLSQSLPSGLKVALPDSNVEVPRPGNNFLPQENAMPTEIKVEENIPSAKAADWTFVRLANCNYEASENDIQMFFSDIIIPSNGIFFLRRPDNKKTGHVYMKFLSHKDAIKAAARNQSDFKGRAMLVKICDTGLMIENAHRNNCTSTVMADLERFIATTPDVDVPSLDDNLFREKIFEKKMTCLCIGNLPAATHGEDIMKALTKEQICVREIIVLREASGKCKGEAYVEVVTVEDCARAADLHNKIAIRGELTLILPMTTADMMSDIAIHEKMLASTRNLPPPPPHLSVDNNMMASPHEMYRLPPVDHTRAPSRLHEKPHMYPPRSPSPTHYPRTDYDRGFSQYQNTADFHRLPDRIVLVKMTNLNFKVTREDILTFFAHFHPISDSVRLSYNDKGYLNGEGTVAFHNMYAARNAVEQRNGKELLQRKVRLEYTS